MSKHDDSSKNPALTSQDSKGSDNGDVLTLGDGHVLVRQGDIMAVLEAGTRTVIQSFPKGSPIPKVQVRVDPVLRSKLEELENLYAWLGPFPDQDLYARIIDSHAARNHIDFELEQTPVLPHTAYQRIKLAGDTPKKIILIGDDDLLSIGLALEGHTVLVLEIDPCTIQTIEHFKKEWDLPQIEIQQQDLTQPLPESFLGQFDLCYTDPLSTYHCLNVFMSRGLSCLHESGKMYVSVSYSGDFLGRSLGEDMNLSLQHAYRDMGHYYTIHYTLCEYISHLLCFKKNKDSQPKVKPDEVFNQDLFSYEHSYDFHLVHDYYDCALFEENSPEEIIEKIHTIVGKTTKCFSPQGSKGKLYFMSAGKKSIRVQMDAQSKWVGIDATPLGRDESLKLERKIFTLLKAKQSSTRSIERNPGQV